MQHKPFIVAHAPALALPATPPIRTTSAFRRVSNFRLTQGGLVTLFWLLSVLALDWDAQWHVNVGRDGFWTPPHWMFYSTVAIAGVICTGTVLLETFLYYRRYPGLTTQTTTPILFFFRGPVGFALAGFGMLVMLISAPFDDYWHRIFGIDVAIWAPFHVMLLLGIILANIGLVYIFASELNRRKSLSAETGGIFRPLLNPALLGFVLVLTMLITRYMGLMSETYIGKAGNIGTLTLGGLKLPSFTLVVAVVPLVLVVAAAFTGRVGIATFIGIVFVLLRLGDNQFTTWGIQTLAIERGIRVYEFKSFAFLTLVYPFSLPLAGLVVDAVYIGWRRWRPAWPGILVAADASALAGLVLVLLERPWEVYFDDLNTRFAPMVKENALAMVYLKSRLITLDYWQAIPLAVVIAAVAGVVGYAFAVSLRYTDR